MQLWEELREEAWEEGPLADDPLDKVDGDNDFAVLPDDGEVEDVATKQSALLALFGMKHCNEATRQFMVGPEMRAVVLAATRHDARRCNVQPARAAMMAAEQRHVEVDHGGQWGRWQWRANIAMACIPWPPSNPSRRA
jgi:hypothetical protein